MLNEIELINAYDNGFLSGQISIIKSMYGRAEFLEQDMNESKIDGRLANWKHDRIIIIQTLREMVSDMLEIHNIPKSVIVVSKEKTSIRSDSKRKEYFCSDCRHADFDEEEKPYCMISEPIGECTSDIESCESHDPIAIKSDTKRTCDETCPHCDPDNEICTKHQMGISPYEACLDYSVDKHRKRIT